MATQQLPISLPQGWESDYDGPSERWFFIHRPTGYKQFFFPKAGDEHTRVAQLAQPQPTNGLNESLMNKMEAMTISVKEIPTSPNQQAALPQQPQQQMPLQQIPAPQSPRLQQDIGGPPLARTVSHSVQRKEIPRRDSVQSQLSTQSANSAQIAAQPTQQYQIVNPQMTPQIVQNTQHTQQAQQYQQPHQVLQSGQIQLGQQIQQPPQAHQYVQNQQPVQTQQSQQTPQYVQNQQPLQTQQPHQFFSNGQIQYQQRQPLQLQTGQPAQVQVAQSPALSPHSVMNQISQQNGYFQQSQPIQQSQQIQVQNAQGQLQQPQYATTAPHVNNAKQDPTNSQRRFSTIPVLHQQTGGQVYNSNQPMQPQVPGTRHSSIPLNQFVPQPAIPQGQQLQQQAVQNGPIPLNYAPQIAQQVNTQPPVQYGQQVIASSPQNLPPPAPGMQWVLKQPTAQPIQSGQQTLDLNKSPDFSVQTQHFGGAPAAERPGMATRISSSTVSGSKKAFESTKGFVKKHPGKTMALVGGLGLVAEACGVSVISDAVAGSKVYANVKNAQNRKKLLNATQTPTMQQTQGVNHVDKSVPIGNMNGAHQVVHQVGQQHPQVLHHTTPHAPQMINGTSISHSSGQPGLINSQQMFTPQIPVQQVIYQQPPHQQFIPQNHHYHHQQPSQQFNTQQTVQSTDMSNQFNQIMNAQPQYMTQQNPGQQNLQSSDPSVQIIQGQNGQQQYIVQQNPPAQYYQPVDNSQQQFQQPNPSPVYFVQDSSGQNIQQQGSGGLMNFANDAYNMLPTGQSNTQSQPQSPSLMTVDNQFSQQQQQQLPSPSSSPFDASSQTQQFPGLSASPTISLSQQSQQVPGVSTSPLDPSQLQQFSSPAPSTSPFDPSSQQSNQLLDFSTSPLDPSYQLLQQQFLQGQASNQMANQAIGLSQQFTNDLLGQSAFNPSIQDDNSYVTSSPPVPASPGSTGQSLLNASMQDDNSYMNAPPSPTLLDTASVNSVNSLAIADDDMSAGIF